MKKFIILLITITLLTGCGKNDNKTKGIDNNSEEQTLSKLDDNKDRVYYAVYRNIIIDNEAYELLIPTINLNSQDVNNVNLELKTFVGATYTNFSLDGNKLIFGNVISYDEYSYENYVTIKQNYSFYYDNSYMSNYSNIYTIDYEKGKLMTNDNLLKMYDLSEEALFDYLSENIDSLETEYILMNIKNDGYRLYINNDGKLVINYLEKDNDNEIEKELIYN